MSRRDLRSTLALVCCGLTLVAVVVGLTSVVVLPADTAAGLGSPTAATLQLVGAAGIALAGAVLAHHHPGRPVAWLMIGAGLAWAVTYVSLATAARLLSSGHPVAPAAGWVTNWVWVPAHVVSLVLLLRFPSGRLPGRRWRVVEWAVLAWGALTILTTSVLPGALGAAALEPLTNPVGLRALAPVTEPLLSGLFLVLPLLIVVAATSLVVRWRRAGTRERAALRWLAAVAVVLGLSAPLALATHAGEVLQGFAFLLLPLAIGAAVLREQLWDLDLRRRYDQLRATREQERERLRSELHDSLGPLLGSMSMRAEAARNVLHSSGDVERVDALLASIGSATEGALDEVRRLIDDLGPRAAHDHDLAPAIAAHLESYEDHFPVTLSVAPDPLPALEERAAGTAYLIVVEAVRNAVRHSGGTRAEVRLTAKGDDLTVEVQDDGCGLDDAPEGVGRSSMRRRAAEVGGRLTSGTAPEGGTFVTVALPGAVR